MTTVNTQALGFSDVVNAQVTIEDVVNSVFKATKNIGLLKNKWQAEYFSHCEWISLYSIKSGMEVLFPVLINISDDGIVELKSDENDWAFFSHLPDEGDWMSDETVDILTSVLEEELTNFISRYWARK